MPGFGLPPSGTCGAGPDDVHVEGGVLIRSGRFEKSFRHLHGISSAISAMRSAGVMAAYSSAIREPIEWPITLGF